jgi:hydroxyethylthiazole kinase-like uncharacterized protein yjeF
MAKLQLKRSKALNINIVDSIPTEVDIIVDSLFGSGLNRILDESSKNLIEQLNMIDAYKIACDIPSGIDIDGKIDSIAFRSDTTITMGALKKSLFLDEAKDFVGEILISDLGISSKIYETKSDIYLLDVSDINLPTRKNRNSHKGNFGHLAVYGGNKIGASIISSLSALRFGAGLVTLITDIDKNIPFELMQSDTLPYNTTAIAIGMGFGFEIKFDRVVDILLDSKVPLVIDADIFYQNRIIDILQKHKAEIVLTPHPKEFQSLLKLCSIADKSIAEIQKNRFKYAKKFSERYPNITLLLKGSNTLIAHNKTIYINSFGSSALSKGGSGDVLSGLISSLLAQGRSGIDSAITASLTHSLLPTKIDKKNYSLTPKDLIEAIAI